MRYAESCKISYKIVKLTNLVVLVHPLPRYCQVPRIRTIPLGGFGCLLLTRLILNRYPVDSTRVDKKIKRIITILIGFNILLIKL